MMSERDVLELDCVVVGAGPAGLAAALRFQQLTAEEGVAGLEFAVLEKGSAPGLHSLSGAVVAASGSTCCRSDAPTACPCHRRCTTRATSSAA
jgi:flavin-dependent dehydrogenase